jgi:hypothetical protein
MHMLWAAELHGVVCTGEQRETYMLLEHRVPNTKPRDREESAADLARRYFATRAPATVADFLWWSGLPAKEARQAAAAVTAGVEDQAAPVAGRGPRSASSAGAEQASSSPRREAGGQERGTWLLPPFDEYLVSYQDRSAVLAPEHVKLINAGGGLLNPCVVVDGTAVGRWWRTLTGSTVEVAVRFFGRPFPIEDAVRRYAAFLERELRPVKVRR